MNIIYHSILENPHLWDIKFFSYCVDEEDWSKSHIDLHLKKGDQLVKLRFWQPNNLKIDAGFPYPTRGMYFEDVSSHGMENIGVYVGDFENSSGAIEFKAKSVEKIF